jgi:hypothetical protein
VAEFQRFLRFDIYRYRQNQAKNPPRDWTTACRNQRSLYERRYTRISKFMVLHSWG